MAIETRNRTDAPRQVVHGVRTGRLLRRRPTAPERGPWMGDVNQGVWFDAADLPLWINGYRDPRWLAHLVFAEAATALLGICYAVMQVVT